MMHSLASTVSSNLTIRGDAQAFDAWAKQMRPQVEQALATALPHPDHAPQRLHQAMRYVTLGGGKRVRPLLVHAAFRNFLLQQLPFLLTNSERELLRSTLICHDRRYSPLNFLSAST